MDRRKFLAVSGLAFAGLAASCNKKKSGQKPPENKTINGVIADAMDRKLGTFTVVQAVGEVLVRPDARVTFALADPTATKRYKGGKMRVFASQDPDGVAQGPIDATYQDEGLGDKGVYVVRLNFDKPGTWGLLAIGKPDGADGQLYGGAAFTAVARVSGPAPGAKAIAIATPTVQNHRGVEPYCTRVDTKSNPAPCSMHAISLDVALANGKPTVFNIGTPKFCTSRVCGPVVDIVQTISQELGDRVNFIHAEVYKDDQPDTIQRQLLAPAPAAWGLKEEPITYWIRPDNTITERVVGPISVSEVRELTTALLS
jgi:hypothetical protein